MSYFKKVKVKEEVFGLVFGHGVVASVWGDGFYKFEVEYDNSQVVPYTEDGIPGWSTNLDYQTLFYKVDIDSFNYDIAGVTLDKLSPKEIIKLRMKNKLLVKCPSGLWLNSSKCPYSIVEEYLENDMLNMFKKEIK